MAGDNYHLNSNLLKKQANWAISTGKLHTLLYFHTQPINVVVFHGPNGDKLSRDEFHA